MQEVDVAIVADVGTLQRLPHIVGQGGSQHKAKYHLQCFVLLMMYELSNPQDTFALQLQPC